MRPPEGPETKPVSGISIHEPFLSTLSTTEYQVRTLCLDVVVKTIAMPNIPGTILAANLFT